MLAAVPVEAAPVLTEALVAHLPRPVQGHLRVTRSMGRPRRRIVNARVDARTATRGQAIWQCKEGDFVCGCFVLARICFDVEA